MKKIMEKSPLKFALAHTLSFLLPKEMGATVKEENLKRCKAVM